MSSRHLTDDVEQSLTVPIVLTVQEAQITPNPATVFFSFYPCRMHWNRSAGYRNRRHDWPRIRAAIVDQPLIDDAQTALAEEISSASISLDGTLTFEGLTGSRATIDLPAAEEITASGLISFTWPSGSTWASAVSKTGRVPDTLTVSVDPNKRTADSQQAVLVLVGDERAGDSPTNVRLLPLNLICSNGRVYLPTIWK